MDRRVLGSVVGVLASMALGAAMLPLRSHLSIATSALVLVVPVVGGVVVGGFVAGLVSVAAGFLVYDLVFIPPYYTLTVGSAQNWVALAVYLVVMVLVARVVAHVDEARAASSIREKSARHLFEMSELLLGEKPLEALGNSIVEGIQQTFGVSDMALLMSVDDRLEVVASAGSSMDSEELAGLRAPSRVPVPLSTGVPEDSAHTLALYTSGRPVGLLVMRGRVSDPTLRELLPTLANHLALALERAQLHEKARHAEILEEIDRLRRALVSAVSHDLRTPLATIKVASSTLLDSPGALSDTDTKELYDLIDLQADRLDRLVASLLDMTRLEAGVLELNRAPHFVLDLVGDALSGLGPSLHGPHVEIDLPPELPPVEVDHLLVEQVLANLLDNADRHAPPGTTITVSARVLDPSTVSVIVTDSGPGVPASERDSVFESFVRFDTGGRAGLGLALAKTFVEAHGGRIWVEDATLGGASFVFTVPTAPSPESAS